MDDFSFEVVDKYKPEYVIQKELKSFNEETRGYVVAEIAPYSGEIKSYIRKTGYFFDLSSAFEPKEEEIDIQSDLGVVESDIHRFQVVLTVKGLENYMYRMLLLQYDNISYPVTIVLSEDIATKCFDPYIPTSLEIDNMREVEELIKGILAAKYFRNMVQQLINEALRQEASRVEPPKPIGKLQ